MADKWAWKNKIYEDHRWTYPMTPLLEKGIINNILKCTEPKEAEPDLPLSVWVSPVEGRVSSGLRRDSGSGCSRPGWPSVWHKPSWRRSSLAPPEGCRADDPQITEQLYQRNTRTVKKVLGATTDFQTWESGKVTEKPQGIWLWRTVGDSARFAHEWPNNAHINRKLD